MSSETLSTYTLRNIDEERINDKTMEPITCEAIFDEWTDERLTTLAIEKGINTRFSKRELRDADYHYLLVNEISTYTRTTGTKLLIRSFSRDALKAFTEIIDEETLLGGNTSINNNVMGKRLIQHVERVGGLVNYVNNKGFARERQVELLRGIIEFLGATTAQSSRSKLAAIAVEEMDTFFLRNILTSIPANFLRAVCEEIRISHGGCTSSNVLAECLIYGTNYVPQKAFEKKVSKYTDKPSRISKKLKKVDLMQWFLAKELREYCDENNLKSNGKKAELAQRIVDFNNPQKENDQLYKGAVKPKKKAAGRKKRTSRVPEEPLKTRDTNKKSKKAEAPVEEPMDEDSMDVDESSSF